MNLKILLACLITSIVSSGVNLVIMRSVDGDGSGLVAYQIITVILMGLLMGGMFGVESKDLASKKKEEYNK